MRKSTPLFCALLLSLSARRAWIEINVGFPIAAFLLVALRKESVDRNAYGRINDISRLMSLSARRAWIEIAYGALDGASEIVALRKESVDRNRLIRLALALLICRSPQGERG